MFYLIVPVASSLVFAMLVGTAWISFQTGAEAQADALPTSVEPAERTVRRCQHCGTIESKRELPRISADPAASTPYEYSLRMADGSSSVFQDEQLVSWRLGERVMVIDGIAGDRKN